MRSAGLMNAGINDAGALEIARRARGTPRIANRLLRRVRASLKNFLAVPSVWITLLQR